MKDDADDPKKDGLIVALIRNRGCVEEAAKAAGVPRSTAYRWLRDPKFAATYAEARRRSFDEALTALQVEAVNAVNALKKEFGPDATHSPTVVSASRWFIALAIQASEVFAVHDELTALRDQVAELHGPPVTPPADTEPALPMENAEMMTTMSENDQRESIMLRTLWMNLVGHDASDIAASVRFNRPRSLADEQEMLDLVRRLDATDRPLDEDLDAPCC